MDKSSCAFALMVKNAIAMKRVNFITLIISPLNAQRIIRAIQPGGQLRTHARNQKQGWTRSIPE